MEAFRERQRGYDPEQTPAIHSARPDLAPLRAVMTSNDAILWRSQAARTTLCAVVGRTPSVLVVPILWSSARRQLFLKRYSRSLLCARPIDCPLLAQHCRCVTNSFHSACSGNNAVNSHAKHQLRVARRFGFKDECLSLNFLLRRSSASAPKRHQIMSRAIRSSKRRVANCAPFSWTSSRPAMRKYVASQESSTSVSMRASKPGWSTA